jgi:hypothetical protein
MVFVHLVQRLIGFGGLETGRVLIGNLVHALKALSSAFGGMSLGIDSTPPVLLLGSSRRCNLPAIDLPVSPDFDLTWKATDGLYSGPHNNFDLGEETVIGTFLVSGCLVLAILVGA